MNQIGVAILFALTDKELIIFLDLTNTYISKRFDEINNSELHK